MGILTVGVKADSSSIHGTLFFLLDRLIQPPCDGLCLVLMKLVFPGGLLFSKGRWSQGSIWVSGEEEGGVGGETKVGIHQRRRRKEKDKRLLECLLMIKSASVCRAQKPVKECMLLGTSVQASEHDFRMGIDWLQRAVFLPRYVGGPQPISCQPEESKE